MTQHFSDLVVDESYVTAAVYDMAATGKQGTFYWRVKSYNDAGESQWTPAQTFQTTAPYITVTTPNGGEKWQRGLEYFIQWQDIIGDDVIIELYKNDAFVALIDTTYSSGGYLWEIPVELATRQQL